MLQQPVVMQYQHGLTCKQLEVQPELPEASSVGCQCAELPGLVEWASQPAHRGSAGRRSLSKIQQDGTACKLDCFHGLFLSRIQCGAQRCESPGMMVVHMGT